MCDTCVIESVKQSILSRPALATALQVPVDARFTVTEGGETDDTA